MKQDTTLFFFALILAFLTGNITYLIKSDQKVDIADIQELNEINRDIQRDYTPLLRLDLNSEFPSSSHLELLKRSKATTSHISVPKTDSCIKNKVNQMRSEFLDKETLWLSFLCKFTSELPKDFFKTAPFIHSNGKSFANMYYQLLPRGNPKQRWYMNNARYMNLKELKVISWPLSQSSQFLYSIDQNVITRIINNEKVIINKDFYLLRTGNLKYFVLDANKAIKYFKRAGYLVSNQSKNCFIKIGNVCWRKKPHNIVSFLSQSTIIIFIVTVFVFLLTANALYQRIRQKKLEEERKKHALRVLTHELRTPVSSLLLKINDLSENIHELPQEVAASVASIESDIYRLKHLAEKSKSYLQTDSQEILDLKKSIFPIKELCEEIINEYHDINIKLTLNNDFTINTDKYWLRMCITNLIENAIRYGKAPIELNIDSDKQAFNIHIKDAGKIKFQSLKDITASKHENSKGLGLGLIIIEKTLKLLGGELLFSHDPTTFSIKLKRKLNE